ncbi:MAG TPA: PAS domain-containing protein, partial [Longimicrobiaceae bacterium]|nr:PAS domain-containing protein [Longimicrobiaceae bacterium]
MLGYPVERWLTEPGFWSDVLLHPGDWERALELRTRATREARDHALEYRVRTVDGRTLWLRDLARAEAQLLRGVMVEITEQKQAEAELHERERQNALAAEVGAAVAEGMPLREMLQRCAEAMVRHLDAAFARIWTLNEAEQLLELQASAGMYTHLDGPHGRVPVGAFKIGKIAEEKQPHLTNDVPSDPRVGDQEWARREGMVAFAGYPLLVAGRVVGVAAIFARHALAESTLDALRGVADRLALVVERRRTERELRERERQLAEAQAIAHLGSWEWEVTADTVNWNDQLYRIFGLPPGTPITFESYIERVHPEDRELVASAVGGALENGRGYRFEHRILRFDGAVRCIASQAEVETDEQGRPVRLFGIAQDVTERKEAAEHAQQLAVEQVARGEAEAAQRRVTRILESITDAFFALDPEWRFTYVNPEAEQLLQRPAEALVGRNVWEEFPEAVDAVFYRMYHQAVAEQRTVEFQEFYPPLDAWLAVRAYPSEEGLAVYFRDITDQKRAEEALEYQSY